MLYGYRVSAERHFKFSNFRLKAKILRKLEKSANFAEFHRKFCENFRNLLEDHANLNCFLYKYVQSKSLEICRFGFFLSIIHLDCSSYVEFIIWFTYVRVGAGGAVPTPGVQCVRHNLRGPSHAT